MAENRIIQLILKAKDEATAVLSKAESGIDSFGRKATGVFKAVAALAVTAALGKFFADAVEEGAKAELGIARLGTAVRNAGGDFKALRPSLEEAIEGVRKLTTYTDDDLRAALTNLITVTGDTSGSVKNLGVVADLAAFKQISLEEASLSVAKAMNGNVTQLNKLGIAGKDSNTVLENLRATVGGFAAGEATTFSGRLTQLNNEWGEFKEAVGTAIISSGEAGGAVGKLTAVMVDLEHWVTANQASISAFVGGVVDLASWVGGQLADLFRGIQIFAVDLALAWDTAGANLRGTLGRILMAFSEFLGQNRVLLTIFGDDLTGIADEMGDAGVKMVRESTRKLGEIAGVRQEMYAEILTTATTSEAKQTEVAKGGAGARKHITKEEADAQEARTKELAKELEKINTEIAVKTLQIEKGLTKDQAAEQVRRQTILSGGVKKIVTTVQDGYQKLDVLNLQLAAGFDHDVVPAMGHFTESVEQFSDAIRVAPTTDFEQALQKIAKALGISADEARRLFGETAKAGPTARDLESAARGAIGIGQALGGVDDQMAAIANNAITLAANFKDALGGNPAALVGAVGGLAGVLSGLFGESPETHARKELLKANTEALMHLTQAEIDRLRNELPGATFQGIQDALAEFLAKPEAGFIGATGSDQKKGQALAQQELIDALLKAGVTIGDLETAAKDLGLELRNPETGKIEFAALQQVLQALKGLDFAKVGEDFASQLQHLEDLIQIGVVDPSEKFGKILELLGKTPSSSPAITGALAGLDVTTAGGRQAATGALQDLIEHIGDLTATEFGKLTRDQFTDVVKQLLELLRSDQPIAGNTLGLQPLIPGLPTGVSPELGAALGGLSGAGFGSGGLGDAFGVAAGTPDFSEFVQVEIGSQDLLRSIDSTLSRGIAPVSLVVNAPMTITVERGSGDAAQIGQAVQEAAAGLADQLVRQIEQALGDNLVTVNAQRGIATRRAV